MNKVIQKLLNLLPDNLYIQLKYYHHFKHFANLKEPKTFNEKIQWLKLHDRKRLYSTMVDKIEAKKYISDKVGAEYVIPTIAVYNKFEDIDFNSLPDKFVIKVSHDSGGVIVCPNKAKLNIEKAAQFINEHMNINYFYEGREWPYKNIKPRILIEQYIEDDASHDLKDFKFFAFNGNVRALFVAADRQSEIEETKFDFYDMDFKHLDIRNGHPNAGPVLNKPISFDKMKKLASVLSKGIPLLRVDFYEVNGNVYIGELTLSHYSGFVPFDPPEWDMEFGSWIDLGLVK